VQFGKLSKACQTNLLATFSGQATQAIQNRTLNWTHGHVCTLYSIEWNNGMDGVMESGNKRSSSNQGVIPAPLVGLRPARMGDVQAVTRASRERKCTELPLHQPARLYAGVRTISGPIGTSGPQKGCFVSDINLTATGFPSAEVDGSVTLNGEIPYRFLEISLESTMFRNHYSTPP
jgi:hypothetical protein